MVVGKERPDGAALGFWHCGLRIQGSGSGPEVLGGNGALALVHRRLDSRQRRCCISLDFVLPNPDHTPTSPSQRTEVALIS